jgi:negative regulator of replication initiation
MTRIYVQPAAGRTTLLPAAPGARPRQVPPAGMWVANDSFTARRLRDGDLVVATAPAPDDAPATGPADTINPLAEQN